LWWAGSWQDVPCTLWGNECCCVRGRGDTGVDHSSAGTLGFVAQRLKLLDKQVSVFALNFDDTVFECKYSLDITIGKIESYILLG
jgi:hypothetical protein